MRQVLHVVMEFLRDVAWGVNAGSAIRHGAPPPAPRRARPVREYGGDAIGGREADRDQAHPLRWTVDAGGGLRLAGGTLPGAGPDPVTR